MRMLRPPFVYTIRVPPHLPLCAGFGSQYASVAALGCRHRFCLVGRSNDGRLPGTSTHSVRAPGALAAFNGWGTELRRLLPRGSQLIAPVVVGLGAARPKPDNATDDVTSTPAFHGSCPVRSSRTLGAPTRPSQQPIRIGGEIFVLIDQRQEL